MGIEGRGMGIEGRGWELKGGGWELKGGCCPHRCQRLSDLFTSPFVEDSVCVCEGIEKAKLN